MSTRPFSHGTVTGIQSEQLSTKTWAEVAKWNKRSITGHWFEVTTGKGAMRMTHKEHPRCSAPRRPVASRIAKLRRADAPTATSFYLFDESGAYGHHRRSERGGLTDGEPMKFAFGNITRNVGWFNGRSRQALASVATSILGTCRSRQGAHRRADHRVRIDSDFVKVPRARHGPSMSMKQYISAAVSMPLTGGIWKIDAYDWARRF